MTENLKAEDTKNEVVLNDDQIICSLTNKIKKSTFHQANNNERKAISMVKTEIESWNHIPTKK